MNSRRHPSLGHPSQLAAAVGLGALLLACGGGGSGGGLDASDMDVAAARFDASGDVDAGPALIAACDTVAAWHSISSTPCSDCLAQKLDACNALTTMGTAGSCFVSSCKSVCDLFSTPQGTCGCLAQCPAACVGAFEAYYACVVATCSGSCPQ